MGEGFFLGFEKQAQQVPIGNMNIYKRPDGSLYSVQKQQDGKHITYEGTANKKKKSFHPSKAYYSDGKGNRVNIFG